MATAEQTYETIITHIEENRLEEAAEALLAFAREFSPDKQTAARMRKSGLKALEEEALIMGDTSSIRERRSAVKLQLFRLADAIKKDAEREPASVRPSDKNNISAFLSPRGEGPVNVFLSYAGEDEEGGHELRRSMALLTHLKRIELFDQHQSAIGARQDTLNHALQQSEVVLLLLSHNFLSSIECLGLQQNAFQLHEKNAAAVIPILYTPCEWQALDIGRLQALPRNGRFITQWDNDDEAYARISREIGELAKGIRDRLDYSASPVEIPTSPPKPGDYKKRAYDTEELRAIFRKGNTSALLQQLITLLSGEEGLYDRVLLLEQRWKEAREDEKNNTASVESITVRKNQLNRDLLELLREMEG